MHVDVGTSIRDGSQLEMHTVFNEMLGRLVSRRSCTTGYRMPMHTVFMASAPKTKFEATVAKVCQRMPKTRPVCSATCQSCHIYIYIYPVIYIVSG